MPERISRDILQLVWMGLIIARSDITYAFIDALIEVFLIGIGLGKIEQSLFTSIFSKQRNNNRGHYNLNISFVIPSSPGFLPVITELAVFEVSCRNGEGLEGWYDWLRRMRAEKARG